MKLNVSNLLTTFSAVLLLTLSAQAQEELPVLETQDPYHRELNLNEDKTLIYERTGLHSNQVKDSIQSAPRINPGHPAKVGKPDANRNNQKDTYDDALSFNFLYYMLQKFKLSDLIDQ